MKNTFKKGLAFLIAVITVLSCIPASAVSVAAGGSTELLSEVQGSMPKLVITIDSGYSLDTIHASKDAKIRAHVQVKNAWDSSFNMSSTGIEMKTRGNSTFGYMKKPYQIKFDSKTDMFGMGKAKKWVLLANYVDGSFVRNKVVFDIAEEMGMPYVCKSVFVDLYINGNYIGVYQLIEKVEIGDNRVPLVNDLGVMVEMESAKRVAEEDFWFKTNVTGKPFVYKEYNTDFEEAPASEVAAVRSYLEERINAIEDELYNNGKDWEKLSSLIDVDSFVQFYLVNELAMNVDATLASTYFYIDGPDDVLHMGPLWDYDRAFGSYDYADSGYEQGTEADFMKNIIDSADEYRVEWFKMLFQYPEFVKRVNEVYEEYANTAFNSERINATIDAYQELLSDSLMKNYVSEGWAIFHNISEAKFFSNTTDAKAYLNYTVNYIKNNITNRIAYLDKAYGEYHPVLFYSTNGARTYSGGSMTDSASLQNLRMSLDGVIDGSVKYSATSPSGNIAEASDGAVLSGTNISGLKISLSGNVSNYFSVQYRVCVNGTWSAWVKNGTLAGSRSGSPITRVQARLIRTAEVFPIGQIYFSCNAPGEIPTIDTIYGNTVKLTPVEIEGYTFGGYYLDPGYTQPVESVTVTSGMVEIYAKYDEKSNVFGDLNGDFLVSAKDVNLVLKMVVGVSDIDDNALKMGDANGDGQITATDLNIIKRIAAGLVA